MRLLIALLVSFGLIGSAIAQEGWIIKDSNHSVKDTADKLEKIIADGPPKLFARVDHAANAKNADLELPQSTLMIFGAPKIGTPIMQQNIKAGLDLPIRVLIWDDGGQTKIGYLDPQTLKSRYAIDGADEAFEQMGKALGKFTDGAAN